MLQTSKLFVLNGEPQSRYDVLRSSHPPRNATRRACPGWLSRAGCSREEPQRPLPPARDPAFMHVYFQVCTQMCGLLGGAWGGSEGGCAEGFEPQPLRPGGKEFAFPSCPDGCAVDC